MAHTVGTVARMAGITIRTLHHYDEIGLLSPNGRSDSGYRLYDSADVARLQQILFYRELGLSLERIEHVMGSANFDRMGALRDQRAELASKVDRLEQMIGAIDAAIGTEERGIMMSSEEMLGVFGDFDPAEYEAEAEERWGHSEAYKESVRRTAEYSKQDWERLGAEADKINEAFLALMATGIPSDSAEAMDVAEQHRSHITAWFYECTPDIHVGLGEMYVQDARFTQNIDAAGEGLAAYMSDAILANGVRLVS